MLTHPEISTRSRRQSSATASHPTLETLVSRRRREISLPVRTRSRAMTPPSPPASGGARLEDVRYLAGGARGPADFFRDAIGGFFPEIFRRIFPQIFAEKFRAGEFALPNAGASGPLSTQLRHWRRGFVAS